MKYCKYCKIKVDTANDFCPICFNHIEEIDNKYDQLYSQRLKNETSDKLRFFLSKLFLFLSICAITVCFFVNYKVNPQTQWFWIVCFGILYVWVLVAHTIMSRRSFFAKVMLQVVSVIVLLYFTEKVSPDHDWLLQYVYPAISYVVVVVLLMLLGIDRNRANNIFGFSVIIALLGTGSLVMLLLHALSYTLLNFINCILCSLTLLGLLIFGYGAIKQDLSKKLHL